MREQTKRLFFIHGIIDNNLKEEKQTKKPIEMK